MEKGLISVDRWSEPNRAYFLTHLHADHTRGLSSKWARGPIYCSPVTAALLPAKIPGLDLTLVRPLEVGSTTSLSLESPAPGSEVLVHVTTVDAHHCPGAVMYLFRGDFGCVLHTGDFRWEPTSERAELGKKMLLEALGGDDVDTLYLDNTFCNPSFSFPPREVAAQQVVDIITRHPDHEIVIAVDTLGKEDLLLKISEALSSKIWVWPERLQIMDLLGYFDVFTTNTSLTRIRAVPRYSFTFATLEDYNTLHPTIGIMPSGLPWGRKPSRRGNAKSTLEAEKVHQFVYSVPYTEHSCFSEIEEFIKLVRPSSIFGIVSSSTWYINPRHYFCHLSNATHLSDNPCKNFRNKLRCNCEYSKGCRRTTKSKANEVRKVKDPILSVRRSRVDILRKDKQGAKLED